MENDPQPDLLSTSAPAPAPAPAASLEKNLDFLHTIICVIITSLILTNLAVIGVFLWETKQVRQRLDQQRNMLVRFHKVEEPALKDVVFKLDTYGQQDREFQNVLRRYPVLFPRFGSATSAPPAKLTTAPTNPAAKRPAK